MGNLGNSSPFYTGSQPISPNNGPVTVSTGVHKLTEEKGNTIARMLALQVHPEQIALLTGLSLRSVYCVRENCQANAGIYKLLRAPSQAGQLRLINEDDINVSRLFDSHIIISK